MANGRALTTPPAFTPLQFGLLSASQDLTQAAPPHWQAGITWQSYCPDAGVTYDPCLTTVLDPDTGSEIDSENDDPATKSATASLFLRGATSFAVYARVDCSPPGFWDRAQTLAGEALARSESKQIETAFATGQAQSGSSGAVDVVYPHLEADTALIDDTSATLQTVTTQITATTLDVVEAIGELEAALADCYHGRGVIHVPSVLLAALVDANLVTRRGEQLASPAGHSYAVGVGYPGNAPDGTSTDGVAWVYATGAVWYYRSQALVVRQVESFDREVNTVEALAERRCLVAWDCCHFGAPVTTGGESAGVTDGAGPEA